MQDEDKENVILFRHYLYFLGPHETQQGESIQIGFNALSYSVISHPAQHVIER
jgi:hypothetical protein